MAKCQDCKQEMTRANTCLFSKMLWIPRKARSVQVEYPRIPYGRERASHDDDINRCHDCNVRAGAYHHLGCDVEQCPRCNYQWISCECHEHGKFEVDDASNIRG